MVGRPAKTEAIRLAEINAQLQLDLQAAQAEQEIIRDLLASDMETKLLMIALGGTAVSSLMVAYKTYVQAKKENKEAAASGNSPPRNSNLWEILAGSVAEYYDSTIGTWVNQADKAAHMGLFGIGGYVLAEHFNQEKIMDLQAKIDTNNPYATVNVLIGAATTATGLAWAALFLHITMGEGGLGGVLKGLGGQAGNISSIGAAVI